MDKKHQNIQEIQRLYHKIKRLYAIGRYNQMGKARVHILEDGDVIGEIWAEKIDDNIYQVYESDSNYVLRGSGKILYYLMMDMIYPNYLMSSNNPSDLACRVWNGINETCEKIEINGKYVYRAKLSVDSTI